MYLLVTALFLFSALSQAALAERWRWTGSGVSGTTEVRQIGAVRMAAVDQIAEGLGYPTREEKSELVVSARVGLRFVHGAAVVWLGYGVTALPSRTRVESGHWWISADSALGIFSQFLRRNGRAMTLQWAGTAEQSEEVPPPPVRNLRQVSASAKSAPIPPTASNLKLPRLKSLRWGGDEQTIRAVLDLEDGYAPRYRSDGNRAVVELNPIDPALVSRLEGHGGILLNVKNGRPANIQFMFPHRSVNIFSLDAPHRLVLDFKLENNEERSAPPLNPHPVSRRETVEKKPMPVSRGRQTPTQRPPKRKKLVVIDAGHGGKDPGAMAHGYREKNIALQIATRVSNRLKELGLDVKMTRSGDTYPSLRERTAMANRWNADVFISIHLNALPEGQHSRGVEIYIMALPTDKDAMALAKIENAEIVGNGTGGGSSVKSDRRTEMLLEILGNMQQNQKITESTMLAEDLFHSGQKSGLDMKRVAQAPFWVLRGAAMPAVLIETGFITELSEVRRLAKAAYQQRMAVSIAEGIMNFLNR